ncbi:hypothetical protein Tco_0855494 [Tanacetum coccineum]
MASASQKTSHSSSIRRIVPANGDDVVVVVDDWNNKDDRKVTVANSAAVISTDPNANANSTKGLPTTKKIIRQHEEEDQRHEERIRRYDELKNLLFSLIQKSSSPVQSSPPVTTKVPAVTTTVHAKPIQNSPLSDDLTSDPNKKTTEKGVRKEGFGCALNMSKGSHLGLRHCATNRKRKKRKGPFVWTKSKSRVVIEVGQTEAIDGGLNCDSRLANYN